MTDADLVLALERLTQRVRVLEVDLACAKRTATGKWLSMADAAAYTGIKLETLRAYVHRGRVFTKYKHGPRRGRIVLKREELDRYLETRRDTTGRVRLAVVRA